MMLSAVIRVRNAEQDLRRCLQRLTSQRLPHTGPLDIVVVDNESIDGSQDVARAFGARVTAISQDEFTWGRALNRGFELTLGEVVVVLSADVEPADDEWLAQMLEPFRDPRVVAVYGRQVPRVDAPIDEIVRIAASFPTTTMLLSGSVARSMVGTLPFLSNSCAMIRRAAWEQVKFDEHCDAAEEQQWMEAHLERGRSYVYLGAAKSYHSHRDPVTRFAYRLWEIHREDMSRRGSCPSIGSTLYAAAAICKRRMQNVIGADAPMMRRAEGAAQLPATVIAFLLAAALEALGVNQRKVRAFMWR